jgi:hypothetical protein
VLLCLDDPWMRNMIYDDFAPRWLLNTKYDTLFYDSITLDCEIWYLVYNTLRNDENFKKFNWWSYIFKTLDAWYDDFGPQWHFNMKYDI